MTHTRTHTHAELKRLSFMITDENELQYVHADAV